MAQLPRPVAVHGAAAEEDDAAWAEALDLEDSDLWLSPTSSSLPLRPSTAAAPHPDKPSRPSQRQRIPGPASAVQDAMRLRDSGISPDLGRVDIQAADADFLLPPWLCALRFLGKDRAWERPGIKRIKADQKLHRVPLVVGLVTSCKSNGLGDLFLTLKDPTDTISASVHRNVFSEGNVGQDISAGCVVLLNKVAVFRPSHTACYLNITKGKVVKVVPKDYDPTLKQGISSGTTENQFPAATWKEAQCVAHLGDIPLGTSEGTASIFSKMVSRTKGSQVTDLYSESGTSNFSASQQSLKTLNSKNPDPWYQPRGKFPIFERGEGEVSANIMMQRLGHEKLMPGREEITFAGTTRTLDSSTSSHKSGNCTDGNPQQNFNMRNTCSQPDPGASSVIPGDKKLWLPFADEIMPPSSKKTKINATVPDCYDATKNTSLDTKVKHGSENSMDNDVLNMAEPFRGDHSSTGKLDEDQKKDFCAVNTGTTPPTRETSAIDAAAANNGSLPSHPKSAISVAAIAGWTDEQLSELFTDY